METVTILSICLFLFLAIIAVIICVVSAVSAVTGIKQTNDDDSEA